MRNTPASSPASGSPLNRLTDGSSHHLWLSFTPLDPVGKKTRQIRGICQVWPSRSQTWNLSKNLHRRIFRLNILHRQFHLILTVLVKKKHKKMSENGEIYTAGKNFTLPPALTAWTNSTSAPNHLFLAYFEVGLQASCN